MIERIDMPPGTLGFRVTGDLERRDYTEVLMPDLRRAIDAGARLRTLFAIGPGFGHIAPPAAWQDALAAKELGLRHRDAWERTAVVTDVAWMTHALQLLGWMMPGELRQFGLADLDEAKAWVAG
jgi:hypothetical protein